MSEESTSRINLRESAEHLRGAMVCVDYADLLAITLPYNRHHFKEMMIITSPEDKETVRIALENDCKVVATGAFYRNGADFNKWLALEESLDLYGRRGWMCLMDADVLWPRELPDFNLDVGTLYTPHRRMFPWPIWAAGETVEIDPDTCFENLTEFPIHRNVSEWAGYSQIFHAHDAHLPEGQWHEVDWKHAGGADSFFQARWTPLCKIRPPFEVVHLGPAGTNWLGRATPYADGSTPDNALETMRRLRQLMIDRKGKRGPNKYAHEKIKEE